ncbi:MAG: hypothetical protein U0903_19575 [Planctomycetales bacterium]
MFTVTPSAGARLNRLLQSKDSKTITRVSRQNNKVCLRYGVLEADDQVFTHDGRIILGVDQTVLDYLTTRTLDIRDTKKGPRLRLRLSTQDT